MARKINVTLLLSLWCLCGCHSLAIREISPADLEAQVRRVLLEALAGDDPLLRVHSLESLALLPGSELSPYIDKALREPIPAVRFAAAITAGDVADNLARRELWNLTQDKNESVQLAAGYALEKLGDQRFKDWYDNVLFGSDENLAGQACMLLGKLGRTNLRKDSAEKLWRVMRMPGRSAVVRLQAAEALARLGDKKVLNKLLIAASSVYADDRLLAISGLRHLDGPDVFAQMTVLAEDTQTEVQLAAIGGLAGRATGEQIQFVRSALKYHDPEGNAEATGRVRGLALMALGTAGTREDIRLFHEAMSQPKQSGYLKIAAARGAIDFLKNHR